MVTLQNFGTMAFLGFEVYFEAFRETLVGDVRRGGAYRKSRVLGNSKLNVKFSCCVFPVQPQSPNGQKH